MRAARKDVRLLIRAAEAQGWDVQSTGSNHFRLRPPDGHTTIILASTPRTDMDRNYRALLKRAGLHL